MRVSRLFSTLCLASGTVLLCVAAGAGCPAGTTGAADGVIAFNLPPAAVVSADILRGIAPLTVQFDSSNSTDDGLIVERVWDFDDGQISREIAPVHTFVTTGDFSVTLTLTDDNGTQTRRTLIISVTLAPVARITVDRTSAESAPAVFNFDASSSSDPDGEIETYRWDFDDGSSEVEQILPHIYARPGTFRARLTVTDNTGVTDTAEVIIQVGIRRPRIAFVEPPPEVGNIVLSNDSPLWIHVTLELEPGTPRMLRAGLDRDVDPCDANATVFNTASGAQVQMLVGLDEPVTAVAYTPDGGSLLVGSEDRTARLYSLISGQAVQIYSGHTDGVLAVAVSPDGALVATGGADSRAVIYDRTIGSAVRTITTQAAVSAVAFSVSGGQLLTGTEATSGSAADQQPLAILWNIGEGSVATQFIGHSARVTSAVFSPAGNTVVTGSVDRSARLWDVGSGQTLVTFTGHANTVTSVAYFSGGTAGDWLLTGSNDLTAKLWDAGSGQLIRTFSGHTDRVTSVAFTPDGANVITGSADGTVRVWDAQTGATIRTMASCVSEVAGIAVSPDGTQISAGIAAENSIQLEVRDLPNGQDLKITVPQPLDLTDVPVDGQYFLWAEIDTDRTQPVRTYSQALINIVQPYTSIIEDETPQVVYDDNNRAVVIAVGSTNRQIIGLGPLNEGDRLHLSLLSTPGYGEFYETTDPFSVLILDDSTEPADPSTLRPEMFAWYQLDFVGLNQDAKLIIGHDANYYLVIDGEPTSATFAKSISIRKETNVGRTPRRQTVYVNFAGSDAIAIGGGFPFAIPVFSAANVKTGWGSGETTTLKTKIMETLNALYVNAVGDPFDIEFISSDDAPPPPPPVLTLFFGGAGIGGLFAFGVADYIDPRNDTLTGNAVVFTNDLGNFAFPSQTVAEVGAIIGVIAAHEAGHLFGLRHVDNANDLMAAGNPADPLTFLNSPIAATEQFNSQIGFQNAPRLLEEILGLKP